VVSGIIDDDSSRKHRKANLLLKIKDDQQAVKLRVLNSDCCDLVCHSRSRELQLHKEGIFVLPQQTQSPLAQATYIHHLNNRDQGLFLRFDNKRNYWYVMEHSGLFNKSTTRILMHSNTKEGHVAAAAAADGNSGGGGTSSTPPPWKFHWPDITCRHLNELKLCGFHLAQLNYHEHNSEVCKKLLKVEGEYEFCGYDAKNNPIYHNFIHHLCMLGDGTRDCWLITRPRDTVLASVRSAQSNFECPWHHEWSFADATSGKTVVLHCSIHSYKGSNGEGSTI
jgi:hypothetical protein